MFNLLFFRCNSGLSKAPQYYVYMHIAVVIGSSGSKLNVSIMVFYY